MDAIASMILSLLLMFVVNYCAIAFYLKKHPGALASPRQPEHDASLMRRKKKNMNIEMEEILPEGEKND